jgi:site-specific DNA-methyltransferase (adenine-specific)
MKQRDSADVMPTRANEEQSVLDPYYVDGLVTLYHGDCHEVMSRLSPESVDAIITDPPYDLTSGKKGGNGGGFMGQKWDATGVAFDPETWREVLRVLKPGAHLAAFGAPRTYHRLACAIEDAGFEIRDCAMWLHGQGFPKSLNVSKAIDKRAKAKRRVVGSVKTNTGMQGGNFGRGSNEHTYVPITVPATPEAEEWDGWGTALKPAWEPIVLGAAPLKGTNLPTFGAREQGFPAVAW